MHAFPVAALGTFLWALSVRDELSTYVRSASTVPMALALATGARRSRCRAGRGWADRFRPSDTFASSTSTGLAARLPITPGRSLACPLLALTLDHGIQAVLVITVSGLNRPLREPLQV